MIAEKKKSVGNKFLALVIGIALFVAAIPAVAMTTVAYAEDKPSYNPDYVHYNPNDSHCLSYQLASAGQKAMLDGNSSMFNYYKQSYAEQISKEYAEVKGIDFTYRSDADLARLADGSVIVATADYSSCACSPNDYQEYSSAGIQGHTCGVAEESTPASFLIHFKATGIQSTGFADYKEAFAALNGN